PAPRDGAHCCRGPWRRPLSPPRRTRPRPLLDPGSRHGRGAEHGVSLLALEHLPRLRDRRADPARHRCREDPLAHQQPAAAGQPAGLRARDRRVGAADRRRRIVCGAPRRRAPARPGADPPLRPASMRRPIVPGLLAALVLLAPGARAAEEVVTATLTVADGQAVVEVTVAPAWALTTGPVETRVRDWIEGSGYALTFLWVALLGLALNLTPCVYPLISVTVAFFGGATGAAGRPVVRALAYVLGICLTFSGLGVVAALTGSMFGAALQRPAVLVTIATVLILLAASNLGLYTFRVPAPLMRRIGRVGEGVLGAFFMGLTMGIVAAPCIGPIVVALLLFVGSRQSAALGFALFFTLALGMGAPYVGLAAAAGRLRRLPRSGPWLEWVERAFAFLLLGLAVYFLAPLLRAGTVRAAYAFLGVAAGIVLGFLTPGDRRTARWSRQLAGLVLVAVSLGWLISADAGSPITWVPFSEEALARATAARRPVLIDVGA